MGEEISSSIEKKEAFSSFLHVIQACVGDLFPADHVFETYCKILINSTEITDCMGNTIGTGLYLGLSKVDHSCIPNVNCIFNGTVVELRSLDTIPAPVLANARVSYNNNILPTKLRQERLREDYYFTCFCTLCSDKEADLVRAGSVRCRGCEGPVAEFEGNCGSCGQINDVDIMKEKGIFFTELTDDEILKFYKVLSKKFHINDYKMCYPKNSTSLGLHLAKLAKTAIYLGERDEAVSYFDQCFNIFKLSHGEGSKLYKYLIALRETV